MRRLVYGVKKVRESTIYNSAKKLFKNKDVIFIFLLFLICFLFFWKLVVSQEVIMIDDYEYWIGVYKYMKNTVFSEHAYYLWMPRFAYGLPFFAWPEMPILTISNFTTILIPSPYIAYNITVFTEYFLALVAAYFLLKDFKIDRKFCLLGSVFFIFNGTTEHFHQPQIMGMIYMPLVFLFFRRAIKKMNFVNIFLCALFLSLMVFSGSAILLIFTLMFIAMYLGYKLIFEKKRIKKLSIFILILFLFLCFSSVRLFPSFEYLKITNRANKLSYEEYKQKGVFDNLTMGSFIKNFIFSFGNFTRLGIIPLILLLLSVPFLYNKKEYLFFLLIIIFILLFLYTPLNLFFYKYIPIIGKTRNMYRVFILASFAITILIAKTCQILFLKYKGKHHKAIYICVLAFVILNFIFPFAAVKEVKGIKLDETYRVYNEIDTIIADNDRISLYNIEGTWMYGLNYVHSSKNVRAFEGHLSGLWIPHDILYYQIALSSNFPKYVGLVSAKYILTKEELQDLNLIKTFEECKECYGYFAKKSYMYENPYYLPNCYLMNKTALYIGSEDNYNNIFFFLFNNNILNPEYISLLYTPEISKIKNFDSFDAVIIENNFELTEDTIFNLNEYRNSNGRILPMVDQESFNTLIAYFAESKNNQKKPIKLEANYIKNNRFYIKNKGLNGFAIFSERFFLFPKTWKIKNNKEDIIYRSNYIQSAVYITENDKEINLKYTPYMLFTGLFISSLTLISSILYINRKKKKHAIKT